MLSLLNLTVSYAQELNCRVTVNTTTNTTSINPRIFKTLEKSISDFMNGRKWTSETYSDKEKINCQLIININDVSVQDVYKADITIQSDRPVFNTSYFTQIFRHVDKGVPFPYIENDPIDFSDNQYLSNLGSSLGYYAYMILALDAETFSNKGGQKLFEKIENICNNVPPNLSIGGNSVVGWKLADAQDLSGNKTKIGIVTSFNNQKMDKFRSALYEYHIKGLDVLADNPKEAKKAILHALNDIYDVQKYNNNYIISMFALAKIDEIVNIFKTDSKDVKKSLNEKLIAIEPSIFEKANILLQN
jgi:hypothetical protein